MRLCDQSSKFILAASFLSVTIGFNATASHAQSLAANTEDSRLTGKQVFEHEWKWVELPAARRIKRSPARVRSASITRALSPQAEDGKGDGLGPLYNATSCADCHDAGGASGVEHNVTLITIDPRSKVLTDTEKGDEELMDLFPGLLGPRGFLIFNTVVHDRSTRNGYGPIRSGLAQHVPGGVQDEWFTPEHRNVAALADRPVIAGRYKRVDFYLSQRNSTALFGIGLIDSINIDRLRGVALRQAEQSQGKITGRVAGRFGWRGQVASLSEFVIGACSGEMGLNVGSLGNVFASRQAGDPADPTYFSAASDITPHQLHSLQGYVGSLPRPIERPDPQHDWKGVRAGEKVFNAVGCQSCHLADIHPVSGMFSDLLLHDMGPRLQDPAPAPIGELTGVSSIATPRFNVGVAAPLTSGAGYYGSSQPRLAVPYPFPSPTQPRFPRGDLPEQLSGSETWGGEVTWDSLQREWRTPPLWGVADTAPYLHDGRAETLEDAILWHGGEADASRKAYSDLPRADKDLVLAFLSSLRAPD